MSLLIISDAGQVIKRDTAMVVPSKKHSTDMVLYDMIVDIIPEIYQNMSEVSTIATLSKLISDMFLERTGPSSVSQTFRNARL